MVDIIDVQYRLVQVKRQKYVCRCGSCVETALGPAQPRAHAIAFRSQSKPRSTNTRINYHSHDKSLSQPSVALR